MRFAFLNPNATEAMTRSIVASARAELPGADLAGYTNADGPAAIQGEADGEAALPGLRALAALAEGEGADAIAIACFDDTGLEELRSARAIPVIGIGQAAFHLAALRAGGFTVLTTLDVSVPVIRDNIRRLGLAELCGGVLASGIPVLDVERGEPEVLADLAAQVRHLSDNGARSIILGCAGMSRHSGHLRRVAQCPVIDPVAAAARLAPVVAAA